MGRGGRAGLEPAAAASALATFTAARRRIEDHGAGPAPGRPASANRDPAEFEDPDTFRVDRNPSHVGFGLGSHFCLGANLARMEMRVVFQEVLRRLPDMEYLAGGPALRANALVRTCESMLVRYTPERRAEDAA